MRKCRRSFLRWSIAGPFVISSLTRQVTASQGERLEEQNSSPGIVYEPARGIPVVEQSDVIVCGAGPAGISAAIAAARCGVKVRLLEVHGCLGGIWTAGLLSWILDSGNKKGLIQEIIKRLEKRDAVVRFPEGAGSAVGYRPEIMKFVLEEMVQEAGVALQLFTRVCAASTDADSNIQAVVTESKSGRQAWKAKVFVDATGDGDLDPIPKCQRHGM